MKIKQLIKAIWAFIYNPSSCTCLIKWIINKPIHLAIWDIKQLLFGSREMVQWVKQLPHKHEDQNLNSLITRQPDVVIFTSVIPAFLAGDGGGGESQKLAGQLASHRQQTKDTKQTHVQQSKWQVLSPVDFPWPPHAHWHPSTHTYTYIYYIKPPKYRLLSHLQIFRSPNKIYSKVQLWF